MADKTINDFTEATSVAGADWFEIETSGGNSRKVSGANAALSLSAMHLIAESSPSGTGTVTFNSIPATFSHLLLYGNARGSTAATSVGANVRFNNDSGSNYDLQRLNVNNTTVAGLESIATTGLSIAFAAASAPSGVSDFLELLVPNYANTSFHKIAQSRYSTKTANASAGLQMLNRAAWWRDTSAISRIDIILSAGNYDSGSLFSLYGLM